MQIQRAPTPSRLAHRVAASFTTAAAVLLLSRSHQAHESNTTLLYRYFYCSLLTPLQLQLPHGISPIAPSPGPLNFSRNAASAAPSCLCQRREWCSEPC